MLRHLILLSVAILLAGCTTGGTKMTANWKDPTYRLPAGERWLVLARVDEPGTRRALEDATAQKLRANGIQASPAYATLPKLAMDAADFRDQAKAGGFTSVLLYASGHSYTDTTNAPGLGTGVGIGPIGVGVGPLIGGSKAEQRSMLSAQLLPVASNQPVWSSQFDVNMVNGIGKAMADIPDRTVNQMKTDHVW